MEHKCCICGKKFYGWGNNPSPVKEKGVCCDICNLQRVIPERIIVMQTLSKKKKEN